ncbi:BlaI/MecI/CopY family transcriptional regulator [Phormidium tenue FACHB-886]|nr:BlaI/MecI/CopY family transcriptional regulator [Phormidium tenue FACHB-886]
MAPLPDRSPNRLSLGSLETEILQILWTHGSATVKEIHDCILADPDRELAYASVTTVLQRLAQKGWVTRTKRDPAEGRERAFQWQPLVSREEAQALQAHDQLQRFLAVGNPDVVAAFADDLDRASVEKLEEITRRLKAAQQARAARQAEEEQ